MTPDLAALYGPSGLPPRPISGPGMPPLGAPKTCAYTVIAGCCAPLPRDSNILATKEQLVAQAVLTGQAIERLKAEHAAEVDGLRRQIAALQANAEKVEAP